MRRQANSGGPREVDHCTRCELVRSIQPIWSIELERVIEVERVVHEIRIQSRSFVAGQRVGGDQVKPSHTGKWVIEVGFQRGK